MLNRHLVKPLSELSVHEVGTVLEALKLGKFKETLISNDIDGECLMKCNTVEDVKEMGITMTVKASILLDKIKNWKATGVPKEYLSAVAEENNAAMKDSPTIHDADVDNSNYDDDVPLPTIKPVVTDDVTYENICDYDNDHVF